jgi:hypothetical protein
MDHAAIRAARFSKGQLCLAFLFSLIFLLAGSIPLLTNLPGLQARFTGVETTARASVEESCDDGGDYFAFTFTDKQEKVHHLTNTSTCFSGIFTNGEKVTLWYQPDDPSRFITANEWLFNMIFLVGFSIPFFSVLIFSVFLLFRRFRGLRTAQEKTSDEHAPQV